MKINARPLITGGIALVGAGMLAAAPAATIAADSSAAPRTVQADVTLAAWGDVLGGWVNWNNLPSKSDSVVAQQGLRRVLEQFAQAPVIPLTIATNVATGDKYGLYQVGKQLIDAPLYVADPFLVLAERNKLISAGQATALHNKAWADRQSTYQDLAKVLGYSAAPAGDHNESFTTVKRLVLDPVTDAPAKIRAALRNPGATLRGLGAAAEASFNTNVTKSKVNLVRERNRVNAVVNKLKDADPVGALKQVRANAIDRVNQVKSEIKTVQKVVGGRGNGGDNGANDTIGN